LFSALWSKVTPSITAGLVAKSLCIFGTTPNRFSTASIAGLEPLGNSSMGGIARRDIVFSP
jgi:hypothetical protein